MFARKTTMENLINQNMMSWW